MEKSMLGEAGYLSGMPKDALNKMIVKAVEPEVGYGAIMLGHADSLSLSRVRRVRELANRRPGLAVLFRSKRLTSR
jgi:hypothetical protein